MRLKVGIALRHGFFSAFKGGWHAWRSGGPIVRWHSRFFVFYGNEA
jgi:hypothetical protein